MKFRYFITTEQQAKIDKGNFGAPVLERLKKIVTSTANEGFESIGNGIYLKRIKMPSRPTFCWFMEAQGDLQVYVLRSIYLHDENTDKVQK